MLQDDQQPADRPRLMSQKTREKSVKKHPLFEPQSGEFGGFSFLNVSFLSEAGAVLTFWYFFVKKKVQRKDYAALSGRHLNLGIIHYPRRCHWAKVCCPFRAKREAPELLQDDH